MVVIDNVDPEAGALIPGVEAQADFSCLLETRARAILRSRSPSPEVDLGRSDREDAAKIGYGQPPPRGLRSAGDQPGGCYCVCEPVFGLGLGFGVTDDRSVDSRKDDSAWAKSRALA